MSDKKKGKREIKESMEAKSPQGDEPPTPDRKCKPK